MDAIRNAKRIVIKVGTSTLTYENGRLNLRRIEKLACVLSDLKNSGKEIILVSSGSISAGVARLGLPARPTDLQHKQAAAAVGQSELMNLYGRVFGEYGHTVAQFLLTRSVVDHEESERNVRNAFEACLELGAIPIVNENDTISTYEIENVATFGDNDRLSAIVAKLCRAQLLILLSDIDGLYDADPRENPEARLIRVVRSISDEIRSAAGSAGTARGSGGMQAKIHAAEIATQAGIPMVIANGEKPDIIYELFDGRSVGTLFAV